MKKKKFSLKERLDYHRQVAKRQLDKHPSTNKPTPREDYSYGYVQTVREGRPDAQYLKTESKSYQRGVLAGEAAKKKSENIKF